ncbi:FHA domain-containing protein [candidate division KSB1 bacterium]|nr:FHA domain-containing protein [candidate division KSB1 bacterium]
MITCHECGTENLEGLLYCDECGAELNDVSSSDTDNDFDELEDVIPVSGPSVKLILESTGEEIVLPEKEEIVIGREDPVSAVFPDIDTTIYGGEDDGVSRKHAKIYRDGDGYFIEDLHSVNSTFVNKSKVESEIPSPLTNGDEVMLGRLKFTVAIG